MSPSMRHGRVFRWRWPIALAAIAFAMLAVLRPQTVVYPATDFARLPLTKSCRRRQPDGGGARQCGAGVQQARRPAGYAGRELAGASLYRAWLTSFDLRDANLTGAELTDVNPAGALSEGMTAGRVLTSDVHGLPG